MPVINPWAQVENNANSEILGVQGKPRLKNSWRNFSSRLPFNRLSDNGQSPAQNTLPNSGLMDRQLEGYEDDAESRLPHHFQVDRERLFRWRFHCLVQDLDEIGVGLIGLTMFNTVTPKCVE